MKKNVLIAAGVLCSTVMFAGGIDNPSAVSNVAIVKKSGTSTYNLIYKAALTTNVRIAIYDAKDQVVFSEAFRKTDGFARPYNFSGLPEGDYTIRINDITGERIEKVNYASGKVEPLINVIRLTETDKYLLTVAEKGEQRISVRIYDSAGALIHDESAKMYDSFGQVYDLSTFTGAVTFEVADDNGGVKTISF